MTERTRVPLVDLERLHAPIRQELDRAWREVVDSGSFIGGQAVATFERALADELGARHAIGVSSGTDALLATLMALGIGPGDEVITTAFTFAAPAQVVARVGATPVFVDIDPWTFNLSPQRVSDAIGPRTKAIIAVHAFGQTADVSALRELTRDRGIALIEDSAQSLGATHRGRAAGSWGDVGCFSFFPTKNLGALGDGGMIATDDDELAARVRRTCHHGAEPKYHHRHLGGNFRLDALQAAILLAKLPHLSDWNDARRANAQDYDAALPEHVRPAVGEGNHHVYHHYVIRCADRDHVRATLDAAGIDSAVYYPSSMPKQPCFAGRHLIGPGGVDEAERACRELLAVPVSPALTPQDRDRVRAGLQAAVTGAS